MNLLAHERFEEQAARTPDAVAVRCGAQTLTYGELNARANRLAHYLRGRGIGPDRLVAVCMERTPQLVAALLAVWKAGGAYVPVDPGYPRERIDFMLDDSGASVVLTDELPDAHGESAANPEHAAAPSNLAYVMYTSGSTGRPKGAQITHGGLANYLGWAIEAYDVRPGASVPVHSSIAFDLTVTSLYPALLVGGEVELLGDGEGAQALLEALRRKGDRALVKITPAHLDLLRAGLEPSEASGLTRLFVIGGESLTAESLRFWREHAPRTRLVNEYGPTETVVGCCVYEVQPGDPQHGAVPIGRPIANTELKIVEGELWIGGAGVARGYLNRPELNARKFANGYYCSGDLARVRADGNFEYLGRIDSQVKVRGYRIELGEIEHALAAHPDVGSCAVLAREDTPGNRQLVAYVAPPADGAALRDFLGARLPEYMLPAQFVFLDTLPLTRNGKVDRAALPVPQGEDLGVARRIEPARTASESLLAATFCGLLGLVSLGVHENLFDLGLHSMVAMQVLVRLRERFAVNLALRDLFEHPTVAALAARIDALSLATRRRPPEAGEAREEIII